MKTKILILEKPNANFRRATGSSQASGLSVCINMIKDSLEGVAVAKVDNLDHMVWAISQHKPDKVLLEALFYSEQELIMLRYKFPNIRFYVHIHSNIPFLSTEGSAILKLHLARKHGLGIVVNSKDTQECVWNSFYLPNIYKSKMLMPKYIERRELIDVVCGGSFRPMKNHLVQAMAAIQFANNNQLKLRFHVNSSRSESGDEVKACLKHLFQGNPHGHELIHMPWLEHEDFVTYCRKMDIGMQLSLSESFNIVAADYVSAGIPMVVSSEIDWCDPECVTSTRNARIIAEKMNDVLNRPELIISNQILLSEFSREARAAWEAFRDS